MEWMNEWMSEWIKEERKRKRKRKKQQNTEYRIPASTSKEHNPNVSEPKCKDSLKGTNQIKELNYSSKEERKEKETR